MCQRIQQDPISELGKALKSSAKRRQRQAQMEKASGKKLRAKAFVEYLAAKLDGPREGLTVRPFKVDVQQFEQDGKQAIQNMMTNKSIGGDDVHVEMLKCNPEMAAKLLTKMWQVIGKTRQIPKGWLQGTIVPLYKGNGEQHIPASSRPLCILSHLRKLMEKAVIIEMDREFVTDRAQYGFQAGIQVTQAALSVLATIQKDVEFVVVLDLAKAYDNILKLLMQAKLQEYFDDNQTNQLIVFLITVQTKVSGYISQTLIEMLRGLTQGGTSSPALFRVFIYGLPKEVREGLKTAGIEQGVIAPIILVVDDVIGITRTAEGLQAFLYICAQWATKNGLSWNPSTSQVLRLKAVAAGQKTTVEINGVQLEFKDVVEYLGLLLSKDEFKGKNIVELKEKTMNAVQMLINEPWFNLALHPKHIAQAYHTYVRRILLFGSELLNVEDRKPQHYLDEKLLGTMFFKLLNLGRGRLAVRHRERLQLALGITILEMDLEGLVANRIDTWLVRRTIQEPKIRYHEQESIDNAQILPVGHPFRQMLKTKATEKLDDWSNRKCIVLEILKESCTVTDHQGGKRQIVASSTRKTRMEETQIENVLEYRYVTA